VETELPRLADESEHADVLLGETAIPAVTALRCADDAQGLVEPDCSRGQTGTAGRFADVHWGMGHGASKARDSGTRGELRSCASPSRSLAASRPGGRSRAQRFRVVQARAWMDWRAIDRGPEDLMSLRWRRVAARVGTWTATTGRRRQPAATSEISGSQWLRNSRRSWLSRSLWVSAIPCGPPS